jgi:hypothetical protein
MPVSVRLQIIGLNPEDIGSVSLEKLREEIAASLLTLTPEAIGAIASDRIGVSDGIPFLDVNEKLAEEFLPEKVLTWNHYNGFGGVPQISPSFSHTIPGWTIPLEIYQRLAALESKTSSL